MTTDELRVLLLTTLQDIAPETDPGSLAPDADLQQTLDLDSMDFLNFVVAVNAATGIEIPERDYPYMATLAGAVEYLSAHAGTPR